MVIYPFLKSLRRASRRALKARALSLLLRSDRILHHPVFAWYRLAADDTISAGRLDCFLLGFTVTAGYFLFWHFGSPFLLTSCSKEDKHSFYEHVSMRLGLATSL